MVHMVHNTTRFPRPARMARVCYDAGERAVVHEHIRVFRMHVEAGSTLTVATSSLGGQVLQGRKVYGGRPSQPLRARWTMWCEGKYCQVMSSHTKLGTRKYMSRCWQCFFVYCGQDATGGCLTLGGGFSNQPQGYQLESGIAEPLLALCMCLGRNNAALCRGMCVSLRVGILWVRAPSLGYFRYLWDADSERWARPTWRKNIEGHLLFNHFSIFGVVCYWLSLPNSW